MKTSLDPNLWLFFISVVAIALAVGWLFFVRKQKRAAFLEAQYALKLNKDRQALEEYYATLRETRMLVERILDGFGSDFSPEKIKQQVLKLEDAYSAAALVLAELDDVGEKINDLSLNVFAHELKNQVVYFAGLLLKMEFVQLPTDTRFSLGTQFDPLRKKERLLQKKLASIRSGLLQAYARKIQG